MIAESETIQSAPQSYESLVLTAKDLTDDDRDRLGGKVQALFQKQRVPLDQLVTEVRSIIWQRPVQ